MKILLGSMLPRKWIHNEKKLPEQWIHSLGRGIHWQLRKILLLQLHVIVSSNAIRLNLGASAGRMFGGMLAGMRVP